MMFAYGDCMNLSIPKSISDHFLILKRQKQCFIRSDLKSHEGSSVLCQEDVRIVGFDEKRDKFVELSRSNR